MIRASFSVKYMTAPSGSYLVVKRFKMAPTTNGALLILHYYYYYYYYYYYALPVLLIYSHHKRVWADLITHKNGYSVYLS